MEYAVPSEAYEVEFVDDYGEEVAMVTLQPDAFEAVIPYGTAVSATAGS